ncbi:MAG TPA: hypothetical protein VHL98_00165 [Microvirga sp.]|jgi:ElaB/YqjD/DUF883 family membrane-anchored ribosome-binding protein|nr:hypothetical protein [Microvirga sp.]
MSDQQKNEPNSSSSTGGASQNKGTGSGSDTLSAAKISAGTSVGNVGQSPMPQSSSAGSGAGSSGASSGGSSAQSSTLASHTSKPMGGTGGTGASTTQASSGGGQGGQQRGGQSSGGQGNQQRGGGSSGGQNAGGQSSGVMDQARDMAGQATETAGEVYEQASEWARDTYEQASDWASDAYRKGSRRFNKVGGRSMKSMRGAGSGVQRYVAENPVMVGLIGLATGLLIGALLPRTRREDEAFGEWADEVREQGLRYAHEMAQRGREYVEESFSGDDPRFAHHESEFRAGGRGAGNRH